MIDFGAPGRAAGVTLLALTFGLTAAGSAYAKDVPGRKRCFVAGVETYKDEPVYRDRSSGYQRVQVPGAKGERCFWEPLDYQAAAAAAPVRPSRAAPSTTGRHARANERTTMAASDADRAQLQAMNSGTPSRDATTSPAGNATAARPVATPSARPEPAPRQPEPVQPEPAQAKPAQPEPRQLAALPQESRTRAERPEPVRHQEPEARPQAAARAPEPQSPPEPVTPVLQPRGLTSGSNSGSPQDLRIQTRPVSSGGTVSTVSSGAGAQAFMEEDQVVPPLGEPMTLAGIETTMASLTPRTSVRGREPVTRTETPAAESRPEPAARREARRQPPPSKPSSSSGSSGKPAGGKFVQLGSVTSYQKAKQFWTDVTGRYPEALSGLSPNIMEADIPGKGIYYRVRVGPFGSSEASALCERLEGNCLVVSR